MGTPLVSFLPIPFPVGGNRLEEAAEGSPQLREIILEENPLAEVSKGDGHGL